jgi:predicted membrane protein
MEAREKRHILTGGMILVTLGVLIILSNMDIYGFDRSWPILLIVIAAGTLMQRVKDIGGWFIGVAGVIFLLVKNWGYDLHVTARYLLPVLLILYGINVLIKHYKKKQQS